MNVEEAAAHEMDTRFALSCAAAGGEAARRTLEQDADDPDMIVSSTGFKYKVVEL